jgi:hypothetical protein
MFLRRYFLAGSCALLVSCGTMPRAPALRDTVAAYPGGSLPADRDGRARFRQITCELVAQAPDTTASAGACGDVLWRLRDEPPENTDREALPAIAPRLQIFVVSGAFSDCREPATVPFEAEIARLAAVGVRIRPVMVSGRSSTEHNARQIAEAIRTADVSLDERIVLVGYSKGAVDVLQYLVDFPGPARQVAAVVSVAGAIQGSPLADQGDWWYRTFLDQAFAGTCDPGDGQVIHSLRPAVRSDWLATHTLPAHIAYYSLAAFTTEEHLSQGLKLTWRMLARYDRRNDGQVVARDAVIPGSTLLGYVNADHWDLAIALESQMPRLSARQSSRNLPRSELLEAALRLASEEITRDEIEGARESGVSTATGVPR